MRACHRASLVCRVLSRTPLTARRGWQRGDLAGHCEGSRNRDRDRGLYMRAPPVPGPPARELRCHQRPRTSRSPPPRARSLPNRPRGRWRRPSALFSNHSCPSHAFEQPLASAAWSGRMTTFAPSQADDPAPPYALGGGETNDVYFNLFFPDEQDAHRTSSAFTSGTSPQLGHAEPFSPREQATARPLELESLMDLDLLSTQNYHQVYSDPTVPTNHSNGQNELYGGLLAMDREPAPPQTRPKTRKNSAKKDTAKATGSDETTRQRGRPRLDTRDQTAAEVSFGEGCQEANEDLSEHWLFTPLVQDAAPRSCSLL